MGASALFHSVGAARGTSASIGNSVNVVDFVPDVSDPATHAAGFQAAIDAAISSGGKELVVPPGEWQVEGLTIPPQRPIRISGSVSDTFPNGKESLGGSFGTRLKRVGNSPIFSIIGEGSDLPLGVGDVNEWLNWRGYCRNIVLQDISLTNANPAATAPLLEAKGVSAMHLSRVVFFGTSGFSLLDLQGVQDSDFIDCYFMGGGEQQTSLPAVNIRSGGLPGSEGGYTACNALTFINCSNIGYFGPGVQVGEASSDSIFRANLICFVNHKMDDAFLCRTPHFVVGRGTGILMTNSWISHSNTAGPIVDLRNCAGFFGDIMFNLAEIPPAEAIPSALVAVSKETTLVDLDVRILPSPIGPSDNVVLQANADDPTIDIRIIGYSQRTNGKAANRWVTAATVIQRAFAEDSSCQYVFGKSGLHQWGIGNPTNPSGDIQQMEIRVADHEGRASPAVIIRSEGPDASTAAKELQIPQGGIVADFAVIGGKPVGVRVDPPLTARDSGEPGMWAADNEWLYLATAPDTWRRVALSDW